MCAEMGPEDTCVLVTGGCGFIGSHTVVELLEGGYQVVIADDLSNSSERVLDRIRSVVGDGAYARCSFERVDVADREALEGVFIRHPIGAVIHFAGFKAVGESVRKPIEYYANNLGSTLALLDAMRAHGCSSIVFSSSATVYGNNPVPYVETMQKQSAESPYAWTKWMIEQILTDVAASDPSWDVVLLRYFNPIGAHPTGLMGEDPRGIPNNLLPYVAQVAVGRRDAVHVFGNDYPTPDGTGVRDYIHVMDLAAGHVAALSWMAGRHGVEVFNLGTGRGSSVLEVIESFSRACGRDLPYVIEARRPGDLPAYWADSSKAEQMLGWRARYDLDDMCRDAWRWQSTNPQGYEGDHGDA